MTKIILSNSCMIEDATPNQLRQIKKMLTIPNPAYTEAAKMGRYTRDINEHLFYYSKTEAGLKVPRGFTGPVIDIIGPFDFIDKRRALESISLNFTGELRDYQVTAVEQTARFDFGVIEAGTGSGKTVIALALMSERKQPTLITVHSKELLYQWRDRIKQFLGIEAGLIGDGHFDIQPVTAGIVNSVHNHLDELKELFGFLVVDECHRCPSKTFTYVVSAFDCQYMLGLSATPYRRDGLGRVINFYMGRTVHRVDKHHLNEIGAVLRPEITQIETDFSYYYQDDYSKMLTALVDDEARNKLIVNEAMKNSGVGTTLLVSDRVNHCKEFAGLLSARGQEPAILTGKTPKKKRLQIVADVQAGKVKFLISTLSLISEGFDCSNLSTLVLGTPVSFAGRLTQTAGRILRPGQDKRPLVLDFNDSNVGVLRAGARKRLRILKSL